jgi:hypothetical protein
MEKQNNQPQEVTNNCKPHSGSKLKILPSIDQKNRFAFYITAASTAGISFWKNTNSSSPKK